MFGAIHPFTTPRPSSSQLDEPFVDHFSFRQDKQSQFVFPFEMMTYCMLFFLLLGFFFTLYREDPGVSAIVIWLYCVFAPFYIPGLYHYYQYLARDRHTEVELDSRQQLIQYSNPTRQENILFHASQIEHCAVHCSILFPYRIDRLCLTLRGGRQLHISGLVVSPHEFLARFDLPHRVEHRLFNAAPRDWPKETVSTA